MKKEYEDLADRIGAKRHSMIINMLQKNQNLDLLHDDGTFFYMSIQNNDFVTVKILLNYFEQNQLTKYELNSTDYILLKNKLRKILEIAVEDVVLSTKMEEVLSLYINSESSEDELLEDNPKTKTQPFLTTIKEEDKESSEASVSSAKASIGNIESDLANKANNKIAFFGEISNSNTLSFPTKPTSPETYEEIIKAMDMLIKRDSGDEYAWHGKANALYCSGRYEEAIEAFDKLAKFNPSNSNAWYNKGVALLHDNQYEEAIEAFDKTIKLDDKYSDALYNKGTALCALGKYEEAIKIFDIVINLNNKPEDVFNSLLNEAVALSNIQRYEEAMTVLDNVMKLNEKDAAVWYNKGCIFLELKKQVEAQEAFDMAKELDPQYANLCSDTVGKLNENGNIVYYDKFEVLGDIYTENE
jgi:tetratricopeptide (TPR) repeat protein